MAIKKSELYSSLWASCDELRGGMDASQYKDYVLVMLFIKYVSDRYAGSPYAAVKVPEGASFKDMVALKGKSDIGDRINKQIIDPLRRANGLSSMPDFNDATKLGSGNEMKERLSNLIAIFEDRALDFSKNRAEDDDIMGDAYEYLMRHFATESGKSKGQFYTPAEVSRILAGIIGIHQAETSNKTTVYDPTCGSGSLLLKVGDAAGASVTLYGQEKDSATSGLALMNMIIHDYPTADIKQGNTLANPLFTEGEDKKRLKRFDYVVANPPFSDKRWANGVSTEHDPYSRFEGFGVPPEKQGDYAYLLHIIASLKSQGKGACILPHGVLFRGNAEAEIRRNLLQKGYIKGIIGLPANLFYGTGIAACIVVLDKEGAESRREIFMLDGSAGFIKDGNKNRLREMDIHRIVDIFNRREEIAHYSRVVPLEEIEGNDYNLNIPRYIESAATEVREDIEGHLLGGIPAAEIEELEGYWQLCPGLKKSLLTECRPGYYKPSVNKEEIKQTIYEHSEFKAFIVEMRELYLDWQDRTKPRLESLGMGCHPKKLIKELSEDLLNHYSGKKLINGYDIYQHLMNYWNETMQDDCYLISAEGWKAEAKRIIEKNKKGEEKDKGWVCDLIPSELVIRRYFSEEQAIVDAEQAALDELNSRKSELEEEHTVDGGYLDSLTKSAEVEMAWNEAIITAWSRVFPDTYQEYRSLQEEQEEVKRRQVELIELPVLKSLANSKGNITDTNVKKQLKKATDPEEVELLTEHLNLTDKLKELEKRITEIFTLETLNTLEQCKEEPENLALEELKVISAYRDSLNGRTEHNKALKSAAKDLDDKAYNKYKELSEQEIRQLVINDKWLTTINSSISEEVERLSQELSTQIKELIERYETPISEQNAKVARLEEAVKGHLERMGFSWN